MTREISESVSSSKNKSGGKVMSFIKKATAPIIAAALLASCSPTDDVNTGANTKIIQIGQWATLSSVVKDSLWLPSDVTSDPKLCRALIDNIASQNDIEDVNKINLDDVLTINMDSLYQTIDNYQADSMWIPNQWKNYEQREVIENVSYTTIHSLEEFKNSDNYLIKKIYKDNNINWKFIEALNKWYSIKFLNPRETKNSPSLSLDEITKPKEILGNELSGKTFVLDPGHGSLDTWAIWLAQYGDESNKEKVAVYESAVMMDLTYRIARELKAHWAKVELTHYMNRRGILDIKDLPPCSRVFNEQSEEVFQDIWNWTNKDSKWNLFNADGKYLVQRATLANKHTPNLFVSLHADMLRSWNTIDDKTKILSIKYDERQGNKDSEKIAKQLLDNWFWYYYQWKLSPDVNRDVAQQHLWVLRTVQSPAVLIEFWNISQESQAYILREYSKREELAKNFASSLIKVYKK